MGLFHRNEKEANFAGGSKNVMESIQRAQDTGTLIYKDPREDFNTNSVITVAPNEQVIFIKNGEFYGTLPSGRHEVKTENYPVLSRIRNMLTGGMSTFTCQVYHVSTAEQNVLWGTANDIEIQDWHLGAGVEGVPTKIYGSAAFRVCFNIREDVEAAKQTFMRLMGDKSVLTADDLQEIFRFQVAQKISSSVGKALEARSKEMSINAISSQLEDFAATLAPAFAEVLEDYGLALVDFSFNNLSIRNTDIRQKFLDRLIATAHTGSYDKAVSQELLKDIAVNPGSGELAGAGAGLGMGMAAGGAFATMARTAFTPPPAPQSAAPAPGSAPDPVAALQQVKRLLEGGLITQEQYDEKVREVLSRI